MGNNKKERPCEYGFGILAECLRNNPLRCCDQVKCSFVHARNNYSQRVGNLSTDRTPHGSSTQNNQKCHSGLQDPTS